MRIPSFFEWWWHGDESIYMVIGQQMARGSMLYVDIWDHKPPFIYIIYSLSALFFGNSMVSIRILSFMASLISILGALIAARYILKMRIAALYLLSLLLLVGWGILFDATTFNGEHVFVPLLIISYVLLCLGLSRLPLKQFYSKQANTLLEKASNNKSISALVTPLVTLSIAGVCASLALITKVHALVELIPVAGVIWLIYISNIFDITKPASILTNKHTLARVSLGIGVYGLSILSAPIIVWIYAVIHNVQGEFWYAIWEYNTLEYVSNYINILGILVTPTVFFGTILAGIMLSIAYIVLKHAQKQPYLVLLAWSASSIVAILLSGRPYPHYVLQAVVPVSMLTVYIANILYNAYAHQKRYIFIQSLYVFCAIALITTSLHTFSDGNWRLTDLNLTHYTVGFSSFVTGTSSLEEYRRGNNSYSYDTVKEVQGLINAYSQSTDTVYIISNNASLYLFAEREPALKWVVDYHLPSSEFFNQYHKAIQNDAALIIVHKDSRGVLSDEDIVKLHIFKIIETESFYVYKPNKLTKDAMGVILE